MQIRAVLFDLDGTLLPMDQDAFLRAYIGGLAAVAAERGYNPTEIAHAIMNGTAAMYKNDGSATNEQVFWRTLASAVGEGILTHRGIFDEFYRSKFDQVRNTCGFEPRAREIVDFVKSRGLRTALATNPLFPSAATECRVRWAGLYTSDFELVTTYEGSRFCKPSLDYYRDVLAEMRLTANECLMVGNDVDEDMVAMRLGMRVFLLTDGLLNRSGSDISAYPHGNIDRLLAFIDGLVGNIPTSE